MRQYKKWKRTGILFLSAAMVAGNVPGLSEGGLLTAQAARAASPVTEYDVETLDKFRDNVLEYWEIPGLVEQYNTTFRNQLEQYYYNPGSSTGLTRQQLLDLADELRNEAKILEDSAEEDKSELTRRQYEDYRSNIRVLKARAKDLEDAAEGKSAAGSSAIRALRITRDKKTKEARALMRDYETLAAQSEIADKNLEIAELSYETAKRQMELGLYSAEDVLSAEEALNAARAKAASAKTAYVSGKQELIKMLGWSYDGNPEIRKIPEPDLEAISGYDPSRDEVKAIENNITLFETRMSSSKSQGGANKKARNIQEQENSVRSSLDLLYRDVMQKKAAYEAAALQYTAARADKAAADRRHGLGMVSSQQYLTAENTWLSEKAAYEAVGLSLTAAMEEYEWAVKGLLELSADSSGS
ncbi:TolC family protein [Lachnospiraceae bacterium 45-P1]